MSDEGLHPASVAFGDVAATYHRARPGYPAAAVDHLTSALGVGRERGSWISGRGRAS